MTDLDTQHRLSSVEDDVLSLRVELTGERGDNGKIGSLRAQVHRQWAVLAVLLSAAFTAAGSGIYAAVNAGKESGGDHARIERAEQDVQDLRQQVRDNRTTIDGLRATVETLRVQIPRATVPGGDPTP